MTRRNQNSRGTDLERRLQEGRREAEGALATGARQLPIVTGVDPKCISHGPLENVLLQAGQIVEATRRVFVRGNEISMETGEGAARQLVPLCTDHDVSAAASSLVANLFTCEPPQRQTDAPPCQFPPPRRFVELLLNHEPTRQRLPRIQSYFNRPTFDADLRLCGPGWHAEQGILVHGQEVEPTAPPLRREGDALTRLPLHLRRLLQDFPFRADSDLVNAVGFFLTGVLVNRYVQTGKPVGIFDGNQPGVGKTLLARALATVLDGDETRMVAFTQTDDELGKRILAAIRGGNSSMVLIDNAKTPCGGQIDSPILEMVAVAPLISLRILGTSQVYEQPNSLLWAITMNSTKASADLLSRCIGIRLWYDGDPSQRVFEGRDPIDYARRHRLEILGELAGMVIHWNQAGRPPGRAAHRLSQWASEVCGILESCGLGGFLDNAAELAGECNTTLDELAALAEKVVELRIGEVLNDDSAGLRPNELEHLFRCAGILCDRLQASSSSRGRATVIGTFLSQHVGRRVRIETADGGGWATLNCSSTHGNVKRYRFQIEQDDSIVLHDGGVARPVESCACCHANGDESVSVRRAAGPIANTTDPAETEEPGAEQPANSEAW